MTASSSRECICDKRAASQTLDDRPRRPRAITFCRSHSSLRKLNLSSRVLRSGSVRLGDISSDVVLDLVDSFEPVEGRHARAAALGRWRGY